MTRRSAARRRPAALTFLLAGLLPAGCAAQGLAFRADDRVEFVAPRERQRVRLPVEVRWESTLPAAADGGPYFVVFVDREPMPPGHTLVTVVDESCRRDPTCLDVDSLRERGVYLTETPSVTLETIPTRSRSTRTGADETHELTVVLVDGDGRRVDEAAWTRRFTLERS